MQNIALLPNLGTRDGLCSSFDLDAVGRPGDIPVIKNLSFRKFVVGVNGKDYLGTPLPRW